MKKNTGFTLIELLIVVVIMAILAAIAVPSYQNYITKAKIKEAQSNLVALSLSAEQAYQRTLSYPIADLTTTDLIKTSTTFSTWNPTSSAFVYQYTSTDGLTYVLQATGSDAKVTGCTLKLTNQGLREATNCGSVTSWVK
ncbi:type IV pilin protein [Acinetobacter sp. KS-LM10]|uniref:type IV pilin protein n=1 Tax=Acinetobacter sp. KS-LM10 TaxID=3120518 RepID=UPI0030CE1BC1